MRTLMILSCLEAVASATYSMPCGWSRAKLARRRCHNQTGAQGGRTPLGTHRSVCEKIVRRCYALELCRRLLHAVVILREEEFEEAVGRDHQEGALGLVRVIWAKRVDERGFVAISIALAQGWAVEHIVL